MSFSIHFAPIQGYTDAVYREVHQEIFGNIDKYYTPFIRLEKGEIRKHDAKEFSQERNSTLYSENKLIPQLLPGNADEMRILSESVASCGYTEININFGCPFPMIAKRHKGCGMLPFPNEIEEVLAVTKEFPEINFSVKMRLGLNDADEWKSIADLLNGSKLTEITIHPRVGKQQYKGDINFDSFGEFLSTIKHPIIYNGEIKTVDDAKNITERYPQIKGIMIGRGLLENPNLANEINGVSLTPMQIKDKLIDFNSILLEKYSEILDGGDPQILRKIVTLWDYLLPNIEKRYLKKIVKSRNTQDYLHNSTEAIANHFQS